MTKKREKTYRYVTDENGVRWLVWDKPVRRKPQLAPLPKRYSYPLEKTPGPLEKAMELLKERERG